MKKNPRCIFHADMDAFFPSIEEILNPRLKGQPVIVGGPKDTRGVVSSASYTARKYGIKAGMPLAHAARLCKNAIFLTGHHHLYHDIADQIFSIYRRFTPEVEPTSVDEAYLDLSGFAKLYGPPRPVAQKIKKAIHQETGLTCSIGIATNKTIAKIASDFLKPNGITEVKPGFEKSFLAPLPIGKMPGIGPVAEKVLTKEGFKVLADIANSSPGFMRRLLGQWGIHLYHKASGLDTQPVAVIHEIKSISRENTFPKDTADPKEIRSTLLYLLDKCAAALRQTGKRATVLTLRIRYPNFQTIQKNITLARPSQTVSELSQIMFRLLNRVIKIPTRVRLIGIGLSGLTRAKPQPSLFDRKEQEKINQGIDHIRARFGFKAILPADTANLHRYPETPLTR